MYPSVINIKTKETLKHTKLLIGTTVLLLIWTADVWGVDINVAVGKAFLAPTYLNNFVIERLNNALGMDMPPIRLGGVCSVSAVVESGSKSFGVEIGVLHAETYGESRTDLISIHTELQVENVSLCALLLLPVFTTDNICCSFGFGLGWAEGRLFSSLSAGSVCESLMATANGIISSVSAILTSQISSIILFQAYFKYTICQIDNLITPNSQEVLSGHGMPYLDLSRIVIGLGLSVNF